MPDRVSEFDPAVVAILACPVCDNRPKLEATDDNKGLQCPSCNRCYPIKEGIPQLVAEDAIVPEDS